jgi:hypothetical protein
MYEIVFYAQEDSRFSVFKNNKSVIFEPIWLVHHRRKAAFRELISYRHIVAMVCFLTIEIELIELCIAEHHIVDHIIDTLMVTLIEEKRFAY